MAAWRHAEMAAIISELGAFPTGRGNNPMTITDDDRHPAANSNSLPDLTSRIRAIQQACNLYYCDYSLSYLFLLVHPS